MHVCISAVPPRPVRSKNAAATATLGTNKFREHIVANFKFLLLQRETTDECKVQCTHSSVAIVPKIAYFGIVEAKGLFPSCCCCCC